MSKFRASAARQNSNVSSWLFLLPFAFLMSGAVFAPPLPEPALEDFHFLMPDPGAARPGSENQDRETLKRPAKAAGAFETELDRVLQIQRCFSLSA